MSKLFIPFISAGYPNKAWFKIMIQAIDKAGADYIEIGVPFSDPIADGPTIQNASHVALQQGVTPQWILEQTESFHHTLKAKLIFFSYFNPLRALGDFDLAAQKLKKAGFYGVLVPDLALEQAGELATALNKHQLHYIPLIAPTTTPERLQAIAPYTTGFAYGVSVTGVTGARKGVSKGLEEYLQRVRKHLGKPFVVGFGISTPDDAREIGQIADGVVVGSALIKAIEDSNTPEEVAERIQNFLEPINAAIRALP